MTKINILFLEDNPDDAYLLQSLLKRADVEFEVLWVNSKVKFEKAFANHHFDLILSDFSLPDYNGLEALHYAQKTNPLLPFILLCGGIGDEKLVEVFQSGATDFLLKKNMDRVVPTILRAINEIEERQKRLIAEAELRNWEKLFHQFTNNIPEFFFQATPSMGKIIYASPAFETIWEAQVEELYNNPHLWSDVIVPEDKARVLDQLENMAARNESPVTVQYNIIPPSKIKRTILARATLVKDNDGLVTGIVGIATDITEHEELNEIVKSSLAEKESMLKEIYHRVKNNLQVVSSLLNLQAKSIQDPNSKKIFIESSARVKSMALVHEMLYRTSDLSHIEMAGYVNELSKSLREIYGIDSNVIKLNIDVGSVRLNIQDAIPCGLIINELISNAFKYAFPANKSGEINIYITEQENIIKLNINDNGVGLPQDFELKKTSTLGMQLINSLTNQLNGKINANIEQQGASFTLTFPSKLKLNTVSKQLEFV